MLKKILTNNTNTTDAVKSNENGQHTNYSRLVYTKGVSS